MASRDICQSLCSIVLGLLPSASVTSLCVIGAPDCFSTPMISVRISESRCFSASPARVQRAVSGLQVRASSVAYNMSLDPELALPYARRNPFAPNYR